MTNGNRVYPAVALLLVAAATAPAAGATAMDQDGCRKITNVMALMDEAEMRAEPVADVALATPREGVVSASYTGRRTNQEVRKRDTGEQAPAPGHWATLLAGILWVVTIARRRMSQLAA